MTTLEQILFAQMDQDWDPDRLLLLGSIYERIREVGLHLEPIDMLLTPDPIDLLRQASDWVYWQIPWFGWSWRTTKIRLVYQDFLRLLNDYSSGRDYQ